MHEEAFGGMMDLSAPVDYNNKVWENYVVQPSPEQRVYLVLTVSMATMGLLANLAGMFVVGRYGLLRATRNVLLFNQMASGFLASLAVVYPVHVVTTPLPTDRFWQADRDSRQHHHRQHYSPANSYVLCYMVNFLGNRGHETKMTFHQLCWE